MSSIELLQIIEIGRDGFDLRLVQTMRDRLHDGRGVRFGRILAALFGPVRQFLENVVVELARQTRKRPIALGVRSMTRSAGRNLGIWNSLFEYFLAFRHEILRCTADGFGIE